MLCKYFGLILPLSFVVVGLALLKSRGSQRRNSASFYFYGSSFTTNELTTTRQILSDQINKAKNALSAVSAVTMGSLFIAPKVSFAKSERTWEKVDIPCTETLFDITFDDRNPSHGWLVGSKGTFLETKDSGSSWNVRSFADLDDEQDIKYRFEVTSITDNDGWIIGKPAILLHSRDGGKQFERLPLSPKLPGDPISIKAMGLDKAEMITSQGAVYTTINGGLNWKAQVKETIDATLNRISSSGTSGASFFTGSIANQVECFYNFFLRICA